MARTVQCVILKKEAPGLDYPPAPGELGQKIYDTVSQEAWDQWTAQHLDTLAAALANAEQFEEAQVRLEQALQRATAEETTDLNRRLALYRDGQPHREPSPADTVQGR